MYKIQRKRMPTEVKHKVERESNPLWDLLANLKIGEYFSVPADEIIIYPPAPRRTHMSNSLAHKVYLFRRSRRYAMNYMTRMCDEKGNYEVWRTQ